MTSSTRRISPLMLLMLSINGIIGSGWLFAPFYAAKVAGPGALIAWLIGGFAAILIALTFAELSVMLPVSGGTAHIPQLSHVIQGWFANQDTFHKVKANTCIATINRFFTTMN